MQLSYQIHPIWESHIDSVGLRKSVETFPFVYKLSPVTIFNGNPK